MQTVLSHKIFRDRHFRKVVANNCKLTILYMNEICLY